MEKIHNDLTTLYLRQTDRAYLLFHTLTLRAALYPFQKQNLGFAFGMGIERLSMLKYGITDMRGLFDVNIKWLDHYGFSPLDFKTRSEI